MGRRGCGHRAGVNRAMMQGRAALDGDAACCACEREVLCLRHRRRVLLSIWVCLCMEKRPHKSAPLLRTCRLRCSGRQPAAQRQRVGCGSRAGCGGAGRGGGGVAGSGARELGSCCCCCHGGWPGGAPGQGSTPGTFRGHSFPGQRAGPGAAAGGGRRATVLLRPMSERGFGQLSMCSELASLWEP